MGTSPGRDAVSAGTVREIERERLRSLVAPDLQLVEPSLSLGIEVDAP